MATTSLLLLLPIGYLVFAILFIAAAWTLPRRSKWLGIAAITAAAPFFYWFGAFSEQFGAGQCYSNVVNMIASSVEQTDKPRDLSKKIRDLPMHGYETVCSEVESAAAALSNAGAP